MSRILKGVSKVFKKVVKVAKKVAPYAALGAAIFFTAGAAAGFAGPLLGAGAAGVAGSGTIGSIVIGALSQAGKNALIGGVLSKATGGSFSQGAKAGAAVGLLSGVTQGLSGMGGAGGFGAAGIRAGNVPTTSGTGMASRVGGFFANNKDLIGKAIAGVGQGLLSGSQADADLELARERDRLARSGYVGTDPGQNYRDTAPGQPGPTPAEKYGPMTHVDWEYQYDPKQGRIVKVPTS